MRILLIDDHAMFRSGMRMVIQSGLPGSEVLEASSLEEALRGGATPSLALVDIGLRGINGLEGMALLKRRWPQLPLIMLSSTCDPDTVHLALTRGATAFVPKEDTAAAMLKVIAQVLGGQIPAADGARARAREFPPLLTPRQCEVLGLLSEGLSNKMIARRLELSEFTVRGHVQSVLGALGVTSRSQAAFAARQRGLIR